MSKFKVAIKSPHIHIALTIGFSIIVMAYFSKRILPEPIGYLSLAFPPFIGAIFELLLDKYKNSWFCKTWYWVVAILIATALVIIFHMG
jgi:hypothetical protein